MDFLINPRKLTTTQSSMQLDSTIKSNITKKNMTITSHSSIRSHSLLPICLTVMSSLLLSNAAFAEEETSVNLLKIEQEIAQIGDPNSQETIIQEVAPVIQDSNTELTPIQQEIAQLQALKDQKLTSSKQEVAPVIQDSNAELTQIQQEIAQLQALKDQKLTSNNTITKTAVQKKVSDTVAQPIVEKAKIETIVQNTDVEPAIEKTLTETVVQNTAVEPAIEKTRTESIVQNTAVEPTIEKTVTETVVQNMATEPAVEKEISETIIQSTPVEPAIEKTVTEPITENIVNMTVQVDENTQPLTLETMPKVKNAPEAYNRYTEIAQRLSISFNFKTEENTLDSTAKKDLNRLIDYLNKNNTQHIVIMGFADSLGSKEYNENLSIERAKVIENELVDKHFNVVTVSGFGSAVPIASNINSSGRSQNRRVEIWVY